MPTIYSTSPYFDDFDETKQFYRILFRPGRAVQARELTQLQTMIQSQIERFGRNIFKDGSIVIPAEQVLDLKYNYVKLQTTFNSVDADDVIGNLVDVIIVGRTTGLRAVVVNVVASTGDDPPTIYVKYLNSAGSDGLTKRFADNEILDSEDLTVSLRTATEASCGYGTAYSIGEGAIFVKGSFVYVDAQTEILEKYAVIFDAVVGFQITESVIDSEDDESLLDNAVGTFNYFAPGASRYKIGLTLTKREFSENFTDDPNFVELARIQGGEIIQQRINPQYSILEDTLARRTYDESGDYIVRPFQLKLQEHLRTTNANVSFTVVDGKYTAAEGGNADLFVNVINPGKAYVKGYEIDSLRTKFVEARKARDFISVNDNPVATEIGNYVYVSNVYSFPNLLELGQVDLYDRYTTSSGSASGSQVGTARVRHLEFYSGTIGTSTAVYRMYLFNVVMNNGTTFVDNVKQIYSNNDTIPDFSADIVPAKTTLTGTVTTSTESNVVVGVGTQFTTEVFVGNFINIDNYSYRVVSIANNNSLSFLSNASSNVTGVNFSKETASLQDTEKNLYLFPFPFSVIKSVDSTSTETNYSTRRVYTRTLSSNSVSITAGTDETFAPVSTSNYLITVTTGANAGNIINPTGNITRSGSPTGKIVTIDLPGLDSNTITVVTTIQKSQSAAVKKIKTLVSNATISYSSEEDCKSSSIPLNKADIFRLNSVRMSSNAFGTAYTSSNSVDITSRYSLDNGQRTTFYDIGSLKLKPNSPRPTGPIQVDFDYFTHGSGDFFSVESYQTIDYKDIPEFTAGDVTYPLRDVLDFRPRISDNGNVFTGSGSTTEMISQEDDLITDYQYYLPRTDKLVLDRSGNLSYISGVSSLTPAEPGTPDNAMALYILKQKPYVFDLYSDIDIIQVDNRRYTMRDIGRIENRVKNLEYYTSLNLLEIDAEKFQVKDSQGFDRFKNGFIVDSFTGHGIGDVYNSDYGISVDYNKKEARPLCETTFVEAFEVNTTDSARQSSNYTKFGDFFTLPYTEELFISNTKSSKVVNLNPFNIVVFAGVATVNPPADNWIDTNRLPDVLLNVEGNYDSLLSDASAKGTYQTVWGNWRDLHFGNDGTLLYQQREGIEYTVTERIDTTVREGVVKSSSVVPKMRDVSIKVAAQGLKPNTAMYAFFDNTPVTQYCLPDVSDRISSNINAIANVATTLSSSLITDSSGNLNIVFNYISSVLDFNAGVHTITLTDSPFNSQDDTESFVEVPFSSSGVIKNVVNEIVSTRNAVLNSRKVYDQRELFIPPPPIPDPLPTPTPPTTPTPTVSVEQPTATIRWTNVSFNNITETPYGSTVRYVWSTTNADSVIIDRVGPQSSNRGQTVSASGDETVVLNEPGTWTVTITSTRVVNGERYTTVARSSLLVKERVVAVSQKPRLVLAMYRAFFGRDPDAQGYQFWNQETFNRGITSSVLNNMSIGYSGDYRDSWDFDAVNLNDTNNLTSYVSLNNDAVKVIGLMRAFINSGEGNQRVFTEPQTKYSPIHPSYPALIAYYRFKGLTNYNATEAAIFNLINALYQDAWPDSTTIKNNPVDSSVL